MWIKKDNIYYKPFYKQKFKMSLLCVILMGFIFMCYQFFYLTELSDSTKPKTLTILESSHDKNNINKNKLILKLSTAESVVRTVLRFVYFLMRCCFFIIQIDFYRGISLKHYDNYIPSLNNTFKCLENELEIKFERVNDDFCDCDDGSDEPSTNACFNGVFYCKYQKRHITGRGRDVSIPSSRVNDRICDCCDGSDEWNGEIGFHCNQA